MRIRILHHTVYHYDAPARGVLQVLRLTPRNHVGQYVVDWRIDVSENCQLVQIEDAFGNISHVFDVDGPLQELRVSVEGEVETQDTAGIVRGAIERFPPSLYLRETDLTQVNSAIAEFAEETVRNTEGPNEALHALLARIHGEFSFDTERTATTTTAAEAYAHRHGVCQDFSHVFIAASRHLGIPARYVSGHFHRADGNNAQDAGHAWAEAYVADLGWIAFDPANGICATEAHVRVAMGLDYSGAAPVRGSRYGGGNETLDVAVDVSQSMQQAQN